MDFLSGVIFGIALSFITLIAINSRKKPRIKQPAPSRAAEPETHPASPTQVSYVDPTSSSSPDLQASSQPGNPDRDPWEAGAWEVQESFPVKANLFITFRDIEDKVTERPITVQSVGSHLGEPTLIAFCRLRNSNRTFRISRIENCIDEESGEIIDGLYDYLRERYSNSVDASLDRAYNDAADAIDALFYVAKADGQMRKPEREIIATFLQSLTGDNRVSESVVQKMMTDWEVPSLKTFKVSVGKVGHLSNEIQSLFKQGASDIVATGKTVTALEQEALDYIAKRLG